MIQELQYIVTAYECKSISKAAQQLGISQSALSQSIRKIEGDLQIVIFRRTKKNLVPTFEGEKYLSTAKSILEVYNKMLQDISPYSSNVSGEIRLGYGTSRGNDFLPKILTSFYEKFPDINISIYEYNAETLEKMLNEDLLDIAIIRTPINNNLQYLNISTDEPIIAIRKDNSHVKILSESNNGKYPIIDLSSIADDTFILSPHGPRLRSISDFFFSKYNIQPVNYFETHSKATILGLVKSGYGVGIISELIKESGDCDELVSYYSLGLEEYGSNLAIVYKKDTYITNYTKELINLIAAYYLVQNKFVRR